MKHFRVEFSDNKLTGNAGLMHLGRFAKKLGLKNILERHLSISRGENAKYNVPTGILMLMMGAIGGVKHMGKNFRVLLQNTEKPNGKKVGNPREKLIYLHKIQTNTKRYNFFGNNSFFPPQGRRRSRMTPTKTLAATASRPLNKREKCVYNNIIWVYQ